MMLFIISLAGCNKEEEHSKEAFMMGTIISLKYYGKDGEKALEESLKRINEIEEEMSLNIEESEIAKINSKAGEEPVRVSEDVFKVIDKGIYYGQLSNGAFDITIRPVDALWAIGTDKERVPKDEEIKNALKYINYKDIEVDKNKNSMFLKKKNMGIDLGGIAKGYTADELVKVLKKYDINRGLINLGGNLYVYGGKEDGTPLNIGIQDPKGDKGEHFAVVKVKNKSVVTSGNYERYFLKDGKRYHHIMDTKTGYPAENGIISSTIISDNSIDGDALSTATYVLGLQDAMNLIDTLDGVEAIFVTEDNKVYTSKGISKDNFNIDNKEYIYEKGR